jgi:hypothetical protein
MGTRNLKLGVLTAALLVAACGILVSSVADAHGGRARVGVFFGFPGPFYYPGPAYYPYAYPYYYPAPTTVIAPPTEYIEQTPSAAPPGPPPAAPLSSAPPPPAPSAQGAGASNYYWYYCPDSQTYYPYVKTCASQWQQVTPRPVPPS